MRILVVGLLLAALASLAGAVENQAYWGMFAETSVMKMAGMPEMPEMANIPDIPGMMIPGRPVRTLNVRLWSPTIAPKSATASIAPPAGLKVGPQMLLELYRPKGDKPEPVENFDPDNIPDFTIKLYWGSSATVKAGQPQVIRWADMPAEQKDAMREQARKASKNATSYFYKPNWTTGYWPTKRQKGAMAADASLVGSYVLNTNYTGGITLDVPKEVEFLAPITLSGPKLDKKIELDKALAFAWTPVPNVLGSYASVIGMQGQNTLIMWVSSEVRVGMSEDWDYLQMATVREYVKANTFMAPDRKDVTAPAGIFKDCDFVMLRMVGYGPGAALGEGQPLPRMQTKTSLNVMLGGKMMEDMSGMKF
jgi:hypothetical protein